MYNKKKENYSLIICSEGILCKSYNISCVIGQSLPLKRWALSSSADGVTGFSIAFFAPFKLSVL